MGTRKIVSSSGSSKGVIEDGNLFVRVQQAFNAVNTYQGIVMRVSLAITLLFIGFDWKWGKPYDRNPYLWFIPFGVGYASVILHKMYHTKRLPTFMQEVRDLLTGTTDGESSGTIHSSFDSAFRPDRIKLVLDIIRMLYISIWIIILIDYTTFYYAMFHKLSVDFIMWNFAAFLLLDVVIVALNHQKGRY
jgi:hypothetical protein